MWNNYDEDVDEMTLYHSDEHGYGQLNRVQYKMENQCKGDVSEEHSHIVNLPNNGEHYLVDLENCVKDQKHEINKGIFDVKMEVIEDDFDSHVEKVMQIDNDINETNKLQDRISDDFAMTEDNVSVMHISNSEPSGISEKNREQMHVPKITLKLSGSSSSNLIIRQVIGESQSNNSSNAISKFENSQNFEGDNIEHSPGAFFQEDYDGDDSHDKPLAIVTRKYQCKQCSFFTLHSRYFLYHQIKSHNANFSVYCCEFCTYCSKLKSRVIRHGVQAHVASFNKSNIKSERPLSNSFKPPSSMLKVKLPSSVLLQKNTMSMETRFDTKLPVSTDKKSLESLLTTLRTRKKVTDANLQPFIAVNSNVARSTGADDHWGTVYKCRLCLFTGSSTTRVSRHINSCHINARMLPCTFCSFQAASKFELYRHKKTHTDLHNLVHKCLECDYVTEVLPNFERHVLLHGSNKPNKCLLCSYATDREGTLKCHVTNHHPTNTINESLVMSGDHATPVKNIVAVDVEGRNKISPKVEIDGFTCPVCNSIYRHSSGLNRHMRLKHYTTRKKYLSDHPDDVPARTSTALLDSVSKVPVPGLGKDEQVVTGQDNDDDDACTSDDVPSFKTKLVVGGSSSQRSGVFKCAYCSHASKSLGDMRRHRRMHSVVKRFKCSYCPKKYKYIGDLNIHLQRDHEVDLEHHAAPKRVSMVVIKKKSPKEFRCPACFFLTHTKADMDRHSQCHTGGKTYSCKLCTYETYWRGDMGRHLYRVHPGQVSRDANVKEFFVFHPDLRAVTKGGGKRFGYLKKKGWRSFCETRVSEKLDLSTPEGDGKIFRAFSCMPEADEIKWMAEDEADINDCDSTSLSVDDFQSKSETDEGTYLKKCPLCSFTSRSRFKMRCHLDNRHNLRLYKCPECGLRANWKSNIRRHIQNIHSHCRLDCIVLTVEEATATLAAYLASPPTTKQERDSMLSIALPASYLTENNREEADVEMKTVILPSEEPLEEIADRSFAENRSVVVSDQVYDCAASERSTSKASCVEGMCGTLLKSELMADPDDSMESLTGPFSCAECGKQAISKGAIKRHYNYLHPSSEVRLVSLSTGIEFNYYTGTATGVHKRTGLSSPATPVSPKKEFGLRHPQPNDSKKHIDMRPFQCSVCHKRSNWKSDIKKHLREKHPDHCGFVIVLQHEQTHSTSSYCPAVTNARVATSQVQPDHAVADGCQVIASAGLSAKSLRALQLGRFRRYKCSGCGYRSNWRTDICRHIKRRHRGLRARVVFMGVDEAKATFINYHHPSRADVSAASLKPPTIGAPGLGMNTGCAYDKHYSLGRMWRCDRCVFQSSLKSQILAHMQGHGMKPFQCQLCKMTFRFRSPIYRHLKRQHKTMRFAEYAKIVVRFPRQATFGDVTVDPPGTDTGEVFVDSFLCRRCTTNPAEASTLEEMLQHLAANHNSSDPSQAVRVKKRQLSDEECCDDGSGMLGVKRYFCTICPFRTERRNMLIFHNKHHRPSLQNKFKCRYCPYYVCAMRLLHQHLKWHENSGEDHDEEETVVLSCTNEGSSMPVLADCGAESAKRYRCEKCPYGSNNKNDFLYHKQFHRPKPSAEHKCDHCDYWVTQRRLLLQHMRLHEDGVPTTRYPSSRQPVDASSVRGTVEIAAMKQKMIHDKMSVAVSPASVGWELREQLGYILHNGMYQKLHQCPRCPYTNTRKRNLRLHVQMHGARKSDHPLLKCPRCDYYVGSRGLLNHHMKVHRQQYCAASSNLWADRHGSLGQLNADCYTAMDSYQSAKVDTVQEASVFKKFCCEKCPYASSKRSHFQRHVEVHGSKQRYTCRYCDYSVPSASLLLQHQKIHMMPNQNLLASQSLSNLQQLPKVPADMSSSLPASGPRSDLPLCVVHDHLELYENGDAAAHQAPPKLYRCDRCPYGNIRRDHLLTHMRFHMSRSQFRCPYCNYSVPTLKLLTQHLKIHFHPLPELSSWLVESGQSDRVRQINYKMVSDLEDAVHTADRLQNSSPGRRLMDAHLDGLRQAVDESPVKKMKSDEVGDWKDGESDASVTDGTVDTAAGTSATAASTGTAGDGAELGDCGKGYECQYCGRGYRTVNVLIAHELQHLIGNHIEAESYVAKINNDSFGKEISGLSPTEPEMEIDGSNTMPDADLVSSLVHHNQ